MPGDGVNNKPDDRGICRQAPVNPSAHATPALMQLQTEGSYYPFPFTTSHSKGVYLFLPIRTFGTTINTALDRMTTEMYDAILVVQWIAAARRGRGDGVREISRIPEDERSYEGFEANLALVRAQDKDGPTWQLASNQRACPF